jgi:hypothetical protein
VWPDRPFLWTIPKPFRFSPRFRAETTAFLAIGSECQANETTGHAAFCRAAVDQAQVYFTWKKDPVMKPALFFVFPAIGLMAACADSGANYTPILDGQPTAAFQSDLADCQALSRNQKQLDQETMGAAALGAGAGALLGAADPDGDALGGAIAGLLAGGVASAVDVNERREAIVIQCLRGRGHSGVG